MTIGKDEYIIYIIFLLLFGIPSIIVYYVLGYLISETVNNSIFSFLLPFVNLIILYAINTSILVSIVKNNKQQKIKLYTITLIVISTIATMIISMLLFVTNGLNNFLW